MSIAETEFDSGIRLVRGQGITHDFPRHVHHSMLFVLITGGVREMDVSERSLCIIAGQGFCLPPECVHACRSSEPHDYYAVSVPPLVLGALRNNDASPAAFTMFNEQGESVAALRHLIAVLRANPDPMAIESALLALFNFVQPSTPLSSEPQHDAMVSRVRERLQTHFAETVRLSDFAAMTGWSASMVNRVFSAHVGVPPYEFLLHQRLREVARLLRDESDSLAEIAAETGFADQSHMQRLFRRAYGVTPKAYRQGANMCEGITPAVD